MRGTPRKPSSTSRQRVRGFTLIEVLVALALVSLLSLLSWRAIDGMGRAGELIANNEQTVQRTQIALAQWTADWNALVDSPTSAPIGQAVDFDGQVLRLVRYDNSQSAGVQVVAWMLRNTDAGRVWQRWATPTITTKADLQSAWSDALRFSKTPLPQDEARTVTLIPVASWQFVYSRDGAWTNPQSDATTSNPSAAPSNPNVDAPRSKANPDAVQLTLNLPATGASSLGGALTLVWVAPTLGATK